MAAKIQPGTYEARVSDYGISATKDNNPQVMVLFAFKDRDGEAHEMVYFGSLKEGKAREFTLKALLTCGFSGDDLSVLAEGIHANVLDAVTPVSIVIDEEEYNGTKRMKVQWVNALGGKAMERKLEKSQAKGLLGALNLKGDLAMLRAQQGVQKAPPPKTSSHPFAPESGVNTGEPDNDFGL